MIAEADKFAEEDKAIRERIVARNEFENYVFQLKDQVNYGSGLGANVSKGEKKTVSPTIPVRFPTLGTW